MLNEKINAEMIQILAEGIYNHKINPSMNMKAHQMKSEDLVHTIFKDSSIGKIMKKVPVAGEALSIYRKANEIEELPLLEVTENHLEDVIKELQDREKEFILASKSYSDLHEFRESQAPKRFSAKLIEEYTPHFALLESYGSKVHTMEKAYYSNGAGESKVLFRVIFKHGKERVWSLELPLMNKHGFFSKGSSEWIFCPMPKNLLAYLEGRDKEMELIHPFEYLVDEMLTVFTDSEDRAVYLDPKFFEKRIAFVKENGTVKSFQDKIDRVLTNAKENSWDEKKFSPVVYFDKNKSTLARFSHEGIIAVDSQYDDLVKYGTIPGIDLLTGSTSTPGVRCKVAFNYEIVREGHKLLLRKVTGTEGSLELGDFMSDYKFSNAGTFLSSAKRDNSCTSKDTYQLVNPQSYKRRVSIVTSK